MATDLALAPANICTENVDNPSADLPSCNYGLSSWRKRNARHPGKAVLIMITLRKLPIAFRVLFSSLLVLIGIGYLTALSLLFLVDIEPHLNIGQSVVEDISEQYHGLPSDTRLESALKGPMAAMASSEDRSRILK